MGVFDPMRIIDDSSGRIIRAASYAIRCMKDLKLGNDGAGDRVKNHIEPPQEFTCNGVLMVYPVITRTGESVEYQPELEALPNQLLRKLIFDYSKNFLNDVRNFEIFRKYEMINEAMLACPLSHRIMHQAVVVTSGETFEKDELHNSEDSFIPNNAVRSVIKKWQLTVSGEGEGEEFSFLDDEQGRFVEVIGDYVDFWCKSYVLGVLEEIESRPGELDLYEELRILTHHIPTCMEHFIEDRTAFALLDSEPLWEVYRQRENSAICHEAVNIVSNVCYAFREQMQGEHWALKGFFIKALEVLEFAEIRKMAVGSLEYLSETDPRLGLDETSSRRALLCLFRMMKKDEDVIERKRCMTMVLGACRGISRTVDHKCIGEFTRRNKKAVDDMLNTMSGDDEIGALTKELMFEMDEAAKWVDLVHWLDVFEETRLNFPN